MKTKLNRRRIMHTLALGAVAPMLAGCWGSTRVWNQKLSVEVQTPEGLRDGSAVTRVETTHYDTPPPMTATQWSHKVEGEATVVDMGDGKYLFALMSEDTQHLAVFAMADRIPGNDWDRTKAIASLRETFDVPRRLYPLLVTFTDITDPQECGRGEAG